MVTIDKKKLIIKVKTNPIYVTGSTGGSLPASFNTYTANTLTDINNRLLTSAFNTYSGLTNTAINNRLLTANNGLTKTGSNVALGGNFDSVLLTGNANSNFVVTGTDNNVIQLSNEYNILNIGSNGYIAEKGIEIFSLFPSVSNTIAGIQLSGSSAKFGTFLFDLSNTSQINLEAKTDNFNNTSLLINDNRTTKRGIQYGGNYSSTYNNRSLPDVQFVTGLTSSLNTTANNGITKSGNNFRLGGSLTGNTTITKQSFTLQFIGTGTTNIQDRTINLVGRTTAGTTRTFFQLSDTSARFSDLRTGTTAVGIVYNANYSSNFVARSLPDVQFVTGLTSSLNTAVNNRLLTSTFNAFTGTSFITTLTGSSNGLRVTNRRVLLGDNSQTNNINIGGDGALTWLGQSMSTGGNPNGFIIDSTSNGSLYNSPSIRWDSETTNVNLTPKVRISTGSAWLDFNGSRINNSLIGKVSFTDSRPAGSKFGIEYAGNYSSDFTNRSLVDRGYVTGLTTSLVTTANNGISKSGNNFRLGGTLTGSTNIVLDSTSADLAVGDVDNQNVLGVFSMRGVNNSGIPLYVSAQGSTSFSNDLVEFVFDLGNQFGSGSGVKFIDNRFVKKGIEYAGNYSTGFNSRSLVDAGYVTGKTTQIVGKNVSSLVSSPTGSQDGFSIVWDNANNRYNLTNVSGGGGGVSVSLFNTYTGATQTALNNRLLISNFNTYSGATLTNINSRLLTANNGLTKSGTNVRLGGSLTGNTTINTNNNRLTISGTTGDLVLSSVSGNTILRSQRTNGTVDTELLLSRNLIRITDSRTGTTANGITYNANYSANFTNRSLPDVQFVTGITSNRVSANRSRDLNVYSDFLANIGDFANTNSGTGAASSFTVADPGGRSGIVTLAAGTTTTGRAHLTSNASAIRLGNGNFFFESCVRIPTLSTTGETFIINVGLNDTLTGEAVDGVYFRYTNATNTGRWQLISRSNSVESSINSTVTVTANQWYELLFNVNANGTLITAFIDGTQIGTINTNIPIAAGRETGIATGIRKTVGVTSRTIDVDYIDLTYNYTVDR